MWLQSGDGSREPGHRAAIELFAGYHNYAFGSSLAHRAAAFPAWMRGTGATVIKGIPTGVWDRFLRLARPFDS